ncbi:MAG TPA: CYTH and CHAD domain-containing protein, partial [Alphaproteobacteria bacterium]|nr:CYTH and CHAD domain-containing protein [Alphaproteobacteria bacterium]
MLTTSSAMDDAAPVADTEIELKLSVDLEAIERLGKASAIARRARNRGTVRRLENAYFDTPDLQLHQRGLALRVRRAGANFVQTLKTAAAADSGFLVRGEWEVPVGSMTPDLDALPDDARRHLSPIPPDALEPLFASRVRRHRRLIDVVDATGRRSTVEVAFDQGSLEAGDSTASVSEVELELKAGMPDALYRLALELLEVAPLRLETESKSDRGYRLATGLAPAWRKPEAIVLPPDGAAETAFRIILRSCVGLWLDNQAAALDGRDPEGVHQMRVALRQFRSALSLFRHLIPADRQAWLKTESEWIADGLSAARDWDVFLTETLPPVEGGAPEDRSLRALRAAAGAAREAAYQDARGTIAAPRYTAFVLQLALWLDSAGWRAEEPPGDVPSERIDDLAERLLQQRHKAVLKAGRHFAQLTPEERHALR